MNIQLLYSSAILDMEHVRNTIDSYHRFKIAKAKYRKDIVLKNKALRANRKARQTE